MAEIVTGYDGYPLYWRQSPDDNGRIILQNVKSMDFFVDNTWIVPLFATYFENVQDTMQH